MNCRASATFHGKVQKVSFREYTKRYARDGNVRGWVRNNADGTVSAVFEGERPEIERVVRRLCAEHPVARVERFELEWSEATDEFASFEIAR